MTSQNDNLATQQLIAEQYPKLKTFFRSKVGEPDCYDLAQETVRALLSADPAKVQEEKSYLWGIARKQVLKYIGKRHPQASFDSTRISMGRISTRLSVKVGRRNELLSALRDLPVDHQMAFELRHAEGLSLAEVATSLEVSLATAKRYIAAARATLAKRLGGNQAELSAEQERDLAAAYHEA